MFIPTLYEKAPRTSIDIAREIERGVSRHELEPGDRLPTVRQLADGLAVSPTTVAAAYRTLAQRGVLIGRGRQGTFVAAGPPLPAHPAMVVPPGTRDLAAGNPDPELLPPLGPALAAIDPTPVLYGGDALLDRLHQLTLAGFHADGVPADRVIAVSGAMDGVERILVARTRPGDRVAVEDPGYPRVFDVVASLGLVPVPVTVDDDGPQPAALERALRAGATAFVLTPRAQNPTGACLTESRRRHLRRVLDPHPDVLTIEDDHATAIAGASALSLASRRRERWAVVRSVAKTLGPDLRVALLAADERTLDLVDGRLRIGSGWVSQLLQQLVIALWDSPDSRRQIDRAAATYRTRRRALVDALDRHGIEAHGSSGLNVWVPVDDEDAVLAGLAARGWAVLGGQRFRIRTPPGIRITIATLAPAEARTLADDLAAVLRSGRSRTPTA